MQVLIPTAPVADALLIPARLKAGATQRERIASVNRIAYPLLGVDPAAGEHARIRTKECENTMIFVTKDSRDTVLFPTQHPMRGRPRYHWVESPDGVRRGYLTAEARADREVQHGR